MSDFEKRFADFDALADGFRQMSEMLTGAVRTLVDEGWTEAQARDLVVATLLQNARGSQ
jgi:hypothetical protein